uniref:Uncharacterized protein n=1 Tax=Siphoviridae sp. ctLKT1 TaxID=2825451 RepID=A0A8S5U7N3_9CAUD|nr:MAG TPA: hypothetical protein [Siphoviridae sp. ctLKT1]
MLSTPPPTTCVLLSICYDTHRQCGAIRQLYSTTQYPSESESASL